MAMFASRWCRTREKSAKNGYDKDEVSQIERSVKLTVIQSDVVIVGAGPAGAATAIFLARRGDEVTLLDRAAFPRDKPCGEYLTPGAVDILRDEIGVLPQMLAAGAAPLTEEIIVPHNGRAFGGRTEALACPRIVTDQVLRQTADAAGVRVIENIAVRQILFEAIA